LSKTPVINAEFSRPLSPFTPPSLNMSSQTVFRLTSRDGFDSLQSFIKPIPVIDRHEVLIKVCSVALNYRDIAIATSTYPLSVKDNVIPCSDMAGEVVQIGELAQGFATGDKVIAPMNLSLLYGPCKDVSDTFGGPKDGVLREYIALPAHAIIKLPKSSHSFSEWAAVVTTGSTVWNAFYGNMPLEPGDTVLVLGMFSNFIKMYY
jgi:NADPH:quinone reductase-like Zn-dependent oxidoreductase